MPGRIHDPATNVRKGTVAYFDEFSAWYRFNGIDWELIA